MKPTITKIFVLFTALIIFMVGAGVTVVDLCCSNCVENLLSMKKQKVECFEQIQPEELHSCCRDQADEDSGLLPCTNQHEGKCCDAERISIDIDHRTHKPDVAGMSINWSFVHCFCCCFCHTDNIQELVSNAQSYSDITPSPPREYLSLIRVLII